MKRRLMSLLNVANVVAYFGGNANPIIRRLEQEAQQDITPTQNGKIILNVGEAMQVLNSLKKMQEIFFELAPASSLVNGFLEARDGIREILTNAVVQDRLLIPNEQDLRMQRAWEQRKVKVQ